MVVGVSFQQFHLSGIPTVTGVTNLFSEKVITIHTISKIAYNIIGRAPIGPADTPN